LWCIAAVSNTCITKGDERRGLWRLLTVIGEGDDELNHELATASDNSTAGSPIGVLPANTVVLLVKADNVWVVFDLSIRLDQRAAEVLEGC